MLVAHRIQLLPNNRQRRYFSQACGGARFAWNWALAEWNRQYQARATWLALPEAERQGPEPPYPNGQALKKEFSARIDTEWPWMRDTTSYAYQRAFSELDIAWRRYFKIARKDAPAGKGMPRFKSKGKSRDSFYLANTCFQVEDRRAKIQKLGWVRLRTRLRFQGKIMSARVSRDIDRWYIAVTVEMPDVERVHQAVHHKTGVNLGVLSLATLANGQQFGAADQSRRLARLKRYQRWQSRKHWAAMVAAGLDPAKPIPKGTRLGKSNRLRRLEDKSRRLYRKLVGVRQNVAHQLTAHLVKQYSMVGIEDLNVKGMTSSAKGTTDAPGRMVKQKAGLNRNILNASFGEIRRQLEYKAGRTGCSIIVIDRFFPSSKTCSACGCIREDMPLDVREWDCACGAHHDRDHNAAKNIRKFAISTLGARGTNGRGADGNEARKLAATSGAEASTRRLGRVTLRRKAVSGGSIATPSILPAESSA